MDVRVDFPVALSPVIMLIFPGMKEITLGARLDDLGHNIILRIASFIKTLRLNEYRSERKSFR